MRILIPFLLTLSCLVNSARGEFDVVFVIEARFLKCMKEKSNDYQASVGSDGLLYIVAQNTVAGECPDIPENPFLEFTQNSGPDGPDPTHGANDPDPLLILSTKEFACLLEKLPDPLRSGNYRFYPERCEIEKQ